MSSPRVLTASSRSHSAATSHTPVVDGTLSPGDSTYIPLRDTIPPLSERPSHAHSSSTCPKLLGTRSLLALCFFAVCGGPSGSEDLVTSAGPLIGLISILVFTVIFYLPVAKIVAELAGQMPEPGGHAYWTALAFGPYVGFQVGYWTWISNCVDYVMYTSMSVSAIAGTDGFTPDSKPTFIEYLGRAFMAMVVALPTFLKFRIVLRVERYLMLLVLVFYTIIVIWSFFVAEEWSAIGALRYETANDTDASASADDELSGDWDFLRNLRTNPLIQPNHPSEPQVLIDYTTLINTLVWSLNGFTKLTALAVEVPDAPRAYKKVMWVSCLLVPTTYALPLLASVAVAHPQWQGWTEGSLNEVTKELGGSFMTILSTGVEIVSTAGLCICTLLCISYLAWGMSNEGFAPILLGQPTSSQTNVTPHGAIIGSLAVILIIINLEFNDLIYLANGLAGFEGIGFILASIKLRLLSPRLDRAGGSICVEKDNVSGRLKLTASIASLTLPLCLYAFVIYTAFSSVVSAILLIVFVICGFVYGCLADFSQFKRE